MIGSEVIMDGVPKNTFWEKDENKTVKEKNYMYINTTIVKSTK